MSNELRYSVPGMTCAHCTVAVKGEVEGVAGVTDVEVDLETKVVVVRGEGLDTDAIQAAIAEAGYEAAA